MSPGPRYLLDANTFIRSKREHYAFDFCPAYWDAIVTYEVSKPTAKNSIQLPEVARHFNVEMLPPYVMLRQLKARFDLSK